MVEVLLSLAALFESNSTLVLLKLINFNGHTEASSTAVLARIFLSLYLEHKLVRIPQIIYIKKIIIIISTVNSEASHTFFFNSCYLKLSKH